MSALPARAAEEPIRVMIVDDSAVVRGLVSRWVQAAGPDLEVLTIATDGAQAVARVEAFDPDVCVLDIEMPVMSGLEALPKLLARRPHLKVIMASTLTHRGAEVTLRAMDLGAADYIPKPESSRLGGAEEFRLELLEKIRFLGQAAARRRRILTGVRPVGEARPSPSAAPRAAPTMAERPDVLLIGSSTGGPPALRALLKALGPDWRLPVVIVQHMPKAFTPILAEHLSKAVGRHVAEAQDGQALRPGAVLVAPGDRHVVLRRAGGEVCAFLSDTPPENYCRPAVDPLFRSAADVYGARVLGVVLTGMGHDGREGARAVVARGGLVIVQDEASSVVWGMPGSVANAGLAALTAPIDALATTARALSRGGSN